MIDPVIFSIHLGSFDLALRWYGVLVMFGIVVGAWVAEKEITRRGENGQTLWDAMVWILPAAIIGARLWYVINAILGGNSYYLENPIQIINIPQGGLHIYGGLLLGGIANYGTLTLNNSTVSGNSAFEGAGGGISNTLPTSQLVLNNSTIANNSATGVAGLGSGVDNKGTFTLINTIIAGNTDDDVHGVLTSLGHNLIGITVGGSGFRPDLGDLLDINPNLDQLGNNGGSTQTHALLAESSAIDQGDDTACPPTDQRGYSLPEDGDGNRIAVCDIGAYEFDGLPPASSATPVSIDTLTPSITSSPRMTDTPSITVTLTAEPAVTGTPLSKTAVPPKATPPAPITPCSGVIVLLTSIVLLTRRCNR